MRTSIAPKIVEKAVAINVGKMISAGALLPRVDLIPTIEVGMSWREVAFSTNNIDEAYSAFSDLSKRFAERIPYAVPAPATPKRFTERFIQTASSVSLSSVLKSRFASGAKSLEKAEETPLRVHTSISPSQTQ